MLLDRIGSLDLDRLQFDGSAAYVNQAFRTLRRMLGKAEEWKMIRAVPKIKLAKEYGRSELITAERESRLLSFAAQPCHDVIVIVQDTGMRPEDEVFTMRWEHVDWLNNRYFVYDSKTPAGIRYVPISERMQKVLLSRFKGQRQGWVFPSKRSKSGHLTTVAKQFREARKKAKLPDAVKLYCGRHTFGTDALERTKNLAAVMKAMGHSDVRCTMRYQHPGIDAIRDAVNQRNREQQAVM